jgi:hypothetical protein
MADLTDSAHDWMPIQDAYDLVLKHRLSDFAEYLPAFAFAGKVLGERLQSGELPSRIGESGSFQFVLKQGRSKKRIPLQGDGTIPPSFWIHFYVAAQESDRLLMTLQERTFAESAEGTYRFRQTTGIKDGGVLEGEATGVEVLRSSLPGNLPKPPGRPRRRQYDDTAVVCEARVAMENDGLSEREALDKYSAEMLGMSTLPSKRKRLRERLREQLPDMSSREI